VTVFGVKRLPSGVRPALERDERVVAWARADGPEPPSAVVVTTRGVWLPGHDRVPWHAIHKATWSASRLTLVPSVRVDQCDGYDVMADGDPMAVALTDPQDVPHEVRTRVTRSVAYTSHHPFPEGGGVRVVGRRVAGRNGLEWHVRFDDGTDTADPEVKAATAALVAEASAPVEGL
jgi:hypothetical protein